MNNCNLIEIRNNNYICFSSSSNSGRIHRKRFHCNGVRDIDEAIDIRYNDLMLNIEKLKLNFKKTKKHCIFICKYSTT